MQKMTGLDYKIKEMAGRIRELREIEGLTAAQMAQNTGVGEAEYLACENGDSDLNFAFIYRCALAFNVDVTDIIEGQSPKLTSYTVTRSGQGQKIEQAHGMTYYNLAPSFQNRIAEPLYVRSVYSEEAQHRDIELTTHTGQECDLILEGRLKVQVGDHIEYLSEGDSIYYNSSTPHGMIAVEGRECLFVAVVMPGQAVAETTVRAGLHQNAMLPSDVIANRFIDTVERDGALQSIAFRDEDRFNFAFDIVDGIADKNPDKLAMIHIDRSKVERRFTFGDMKRASNQCANYFKSLGIRKGDRVMLVLRRNYAFWFAILGLHKLGAVAIPATDQLQAKDFKYRFDAAGVRAVITTAESHAVGQIDEAAAECQQLEFKLLVGGTRDGWHDFDDEYKLYSTHYKRAADAPCGDDLMLMFFTSGTTGYPKIAAHNFKYALGHFHTAKYWHCVDPDGLHLTISDTGWAKAMWGKFYGQWICEAGLFVYDFDRFHAENFEKLDRRI